MRPDKPLYTTRLDDSLVFAADAFRKIARKGTGIPYLAHLLAVMVNVAEWGGDEDQLIAAVLHDTLEDIEGATVQMLSQRFGKHVADMVLALSDTTDPTCKPPWKERKLRYIRHLEHVPTDVRLVCAADKLHNAQSIRRDLKVLGEEIWSRFHATRDETLWYYREVHRALGHGWNHPLLDLLGSEVASLHEAAGVSLNSDNAPV